MNLSEVLNVALPELPARRSKGYPRLHPNMIAREQMEGGEAVMVTMISGEPLIFRFTPEQWRLVQLFDGERSYKQIAEAYTQEVGALLGEDVVREMADALEESAFWYKTPLERNITASEKLRDERQRRVKKKKVDLALMSLSAWDPDNFLTKAYSVLKFIYTKWFTLLTLAAFAVMALIFASGWSEIWRDTIRYYTFTEKGAGDIAEFWLLFCAIGFFHETAHGLTCKHYGGAVHRMGFMLVYLSPAFFCDVGEVYVYGGKWPRVAAIVAGIWTELMFCAAASIIWWGTPVGSPVHDFAYKIMLLTGVAVVLMNLNPLIKLDGYYLFGEMVGVPTLKESSTEYVSSWVKKHILRLPVEVPYLSPRRRWLFSLYAITSGVYSYTVLFAIVGLTYNISAHFTPQWAFVPALALALLIFRERLRSTVRFARDFYLDKKPKLATLAKPRRTAVAVTFAAILLFAPVWRETVSGRFLLEPQQRAVVRATTPGQVTSVAADEGTLVERGVPLLTLQNIATESAADLAHTDLRTAQVNLRESQINFRDLAQSRAELASRSVKVKAASQELADLNITSPMTGVVVTPGLRDLLGSFVESGRPLAEIDDIRNLKASIYVPEFEMRRITAGLPISLKFESEFQPLRGTVDSVGPVASEIAPGLIVQEEYKGIVAPHYYVATALIANTAGDLRPGMSGDAKIRIARRSIAGLCWDGVGEFVRRKIW